MIDWHCHMLPGLDDGAGSVDESLEMAALLASVGYSHVCCTPHRLRGMYDTAPSLMREKLAELQGCLDSEGIPLVLLAGMEYCLDEFFTEDFFAEPVTLGQTRRVLVETPANADPALLRENIFQLVRAGYTPLFAHPERHAFLAPPSKKSGSLFSRIKGWGSAQAEQGRGRLIDELAMMGAVFQGNLGSVAGYYGSLVKLQELLFRGQGIYSCYGSDGHRAADMQDYLADALAEVRTDRPDLFAADADPIAS